jgi:single-stranded DNA-binding protein
MNSCVLMAEIIQAPQLRYTQDGQMAIAEMQVQFSPLRAGDPMQSLKVIGWGNLAQQIQEQFHEGDQVVLEGRLGMNTIDRPEGYKEKQAELTVTRIFPVAGGLAAPAIADGFDSGADYGAMPATAPAPAAAAPVSAPAVAASPVAAPSGAPATPRPAPARPAAAPAEPPGIEPNFDDIPF